MTQGAGISPALTTLARLATETGGRYTERTNDLSLAYARAQRDLACVYSVGFYDDRPQDSLRSVTIRVKRKGMRAIHPNRYRFRSDEERNVSMVRAAWVAPEMFQTGLVRAHVFPLRPLGPKTWDALLAVSFPVPLAGAEGEAVARDFGAVLSKRKSMGGETVVGRFDRRVTLRPEDGDTDSTPVITFLHRLRVSPGSYRATAVVTEVGQPKPEAARIDVEVPEIPRKELFLVGPLIGRHSGPNLVVMSDGTQAAQDRLGQEDTFEPLLVQHFAGPSDVLALTQACLVGGKAPRARKGERLEVARSVRRMDGTEIGTLEAEPLSLEGEGKIACQNLIDFLPAASVRQDGEYVFEAELQGARNGDTDLRRVVFSVGPAGGP